jgi:hypothetical protein
VKLPELLGKYEEHGLLRGIDQRGNQLGAQSPAFGKDRWSGWHRAQVIQHHLEPFDEAQAGVGGHLVWCAVDPHVVRVAVQRGEKGVAVRVVVRVGAGTIGVAPGIVIVVSVQQQRVPHGQQVCHHGLARPLRPTDPQYPLQVQMGCYSHAIPRPTVQAAWLFFIAPCSRAMA